ncbi:D-cysteine desulfhydrase family protein [Rhodococcus sp. B10]|uniref:pyridoxal-phosphate dependent enzyme n=1 Tax=Rhodococcus sp. B10 TaxID=2695876 RepID=UPI0014311F5B|nr:D-cysteine desulfhydrase [Rhodococcus sp. B10]
MTSNAPRVELGIWPTPLEPAPRLAEAIGLRSSDLWIKRDDLTGLAAGGNKIRKLEWTVGAALAEGADVLVTTGAPQSNHARLTAAAAARLGLRSVLVFPGAPVHEQQGNILLDALLGAEIVWTGPVPDGVDVQVLLDRTARSTAEELRRDGRRPAIVPFGGSNAVGALGYRDAAAEILQQRPDVDHVVCAVGSGGTMAGLVAGLGPDRALGVDVGAVPDAAARVAHMLGELGATTTATDLNIRADQVGEGYEHLTPQAQNALVTAARTEGLILDPTYTARALAGLSAAVSDGSISPGDTTVFLASGGLPGLFGHPEVQGISTWG